MSKSTAEKGVNELEKSGFVLTFAVEVLGLDIWHDCKEGWLDLGPCVRGLNFQYELYPGRNYEIDVLIWPHTVKVFRGCCALKALLHLIS